MTLARQKDTAVRRLSKQAAATISGTTFGPDSKENTRTVAAIIENTFKESLAVAAEPKPVEEAFDDVGELHQCGNCEAYWPFESLNDIHKLYERVQPGEIMPSGECPKCGSLCHPVGSDETEEEDDGEETGKAGTGSELQVGQGDSTERKRSHGEA